MGRLLTKLRERLLERKEFLAEKQALFQKL